MLYRCEDCDAHFASRDDVSYCPACGKEAITEHNLFGRGVADNH